MTLKELHQKDEVAWMEAMADLVRQQRYEELDYTNLEAWLDEMAQRERREVKSRLTVLLTHLLKTDFQPENASRSWQVTILNQRQELDELLDSSVLRTYAETSLPSAYANAVKRAALETGLPETAFPAACPYSLTQALDEETSS